MKPGVLNGRGRVHVEAADHTCTVDDEILHGPIKVAETLRVVLVQCA